MTKGDAATPPRRAPPLPPTAEFHPALAVNNIKNAIPLVLDYEKVQYSNWVELFENHACVYNVLDHIDPTVKRPSDISDSLWQRLDALVKQWIYATITPDLLQTILSRKSTVQETWDSIKEIFQDNKNSRAVYLEAQFNMLHLNNFPNITAYCQELKSISDQLANIDHAISDPKLVIRLVFGLANTNYDTVATLIQQTDPLPSFNIARSRLLLEESRRANDHGSSTQSTCVTKHDSPATSGQPHAQQHHMNGGRNSGNGKGGSRGGRNGGRGNSSKGRGRGRGNNNYKHHGHNQQSQQQQYANQQTQWASPQRWPNYPGGNLETGPKLLVLSPLPKA